MTQTGSRIEIRDLRAWRLARHLTQEQLAERSGVARMTIFKIENHKGAVYSVTVRRLAQALGITPERLAYELPTP